MTTRLAGIAFLCVAISYAAVEPLGDGVLDAARNDETTALTAALARGANPNAAQEDGTTALAWTVVRHNTESSTLLLKKKANANLPNMYGITPLSLAVENGSDSLAALLLNNGADPNL